MNKAEKFAYIFRRVSKASVIPMMFIIAMTEAYWLAGVMSIALVYSYVLEYQGIGDERDV